MIPYEVIIADDGSENETRRLIEREALDFPCALKHSWQEDIGFRVARSRNLAIASSKSDYIILIDGDIVLHRHFVRDHINAARVGFFTQGSRALMSESSSQKIISTKKTALGFFSPGIERRRHTLHLPVFGRLWLYLSRGHKRRGIKTCNQGWWRCDLILLNGFDERMTSWGCEDDELAARAFHSGLKRQDFRFTAPAYHLWHKERRNNDYSPNLKFLHETNRLRLTRAADGLDKHIYASGHDAYARSPDTISGSSSWQHL